MAETFMDDDGDGLSEWPVLQWSPAMTTEGNAT
jgi:hypothetical protein